MCGAKPPLTQYTFMAWMSVKKKAQGKLKGKVKFYLYDIRTSLSII
jgi:hypothetical protein